MCTFAAGMHAGYLASHMRKFFTHENFHAPLINTAFEPNVFFKATVSPLGKKKWQTNSTACEPFAFIYKLIKS